MAILDDVKSYARIDFNDDDATLTTLIEMSRRFILTATGYTIVDTVEFDKIVLSMTVKHFYDNRDAIVSNGAVPQTVPLTLRSLFLQLQSSVVVNPL